MKKVKLLFLAMSVVLSTLYSCSDGDSISNDSNLQESMALRTVLNNMKNATNGAGRVSNANATQSIGLIFDFVYPITVSYNDGSTITIASQQGLLDVLANENQNLYIDSIQFPVQIVLTSDGTIITINDEAAFWDFIDTIDIQTMDDYVFSSPCYEFVYPFSLVTQNNQTIVIANQSELLNLFTNPNSQTIILDFVYPFSVISNNQTVVINDAYQFFDLNSDCLPSTCICTTDYNPVCVSTPSGIEEFPNACYAECAGYTAADFVNCSPNTGTGFEQLGTCFTIQYPVQVQFLGAVYSVYSDSEFLTFINNPAGATVNYPIVINHATTPMMFTIQSQTGLLDVVSQLCN